MDMAMLTYTLKEIRNRISENFLYSAGYVTTFHDILHEIAHFILLYGSNIKKYDRRRWGNMNNIIAKFSPKRSQLHELRAVALHYTVAAEVGWRPSKRKLLEASWSGINAIAFENEEKRLHKNLVRNRKTMTAVFNTLITQVSRNNVERFKKWLYTWIKTISTPY